MGLRLNPTNGKLERVLDNAADIITDVTNFDGALTAADTDIQKALETLDDVIAGGSAIWGAITGTLSNQTDLQTALDGKANTVHSHLEADITDLDKYTQAEVDAFLNNKMNISGDNSFVDNFFFNTAFNAPLHQEGIVFYDKDEHTLALYNDESEVTHQLGQELLIRVFNNSGATIVDGQAVYINGAEGVEGRPTIALGLADNINTANVIGLTTHDILDQTFGYVTHIGFVNNLDTAAFTAGDTLYLSITVLGGLTPTKPSEGDIVVEVASAIKIGTTDGRLLVHVSSEGPSSSTVTKTLLFRPERVNSEGNYKIKKVGQGGTENFTFSIPTDFNTLVDLSLVFAPEGTIAASQTVDLNSDYATIGEDLQTHSETSLAVPIAGTINTLNLLDISSVFNSISADDLCGININLNNIGQGISVFGIRLRYT